jgi:hypothetical protein
LHIGLCCFAGKQCAQFIVHAALDRFEEITGPASGSRWRTPGASGSDAMWVGLLSPVEDMRVYGYLANTGIKFIGVIEDTDEVGGQHQQMRETELKNLFVSSKLILVLLMIRWNVYL